MAIFLSAFGLGLAVVATPGAVTTQAVQKGLERGFYAALLVQFGALVGLALWSSIGLMGAALIAENVITRLVLSVVGILLLLWLTVQALRDAVRGRSQKTSLTSVRGDFGLGVALSVMNPLPVAFWLGIGSSVVPSPTPTDVAVFFTGLMSSAVLWSLFLAGLAAWGQRFITPFLFRIVSLLCGLTLIVVATRMAENILMIF